MKKRLIALIVSAFLLFVSSMPILAYADEPMLIDSYSKDLLVDNADLLTDEEELDIEAKLEEISQRQRVDVVILTVNSLEGKDRVAYADDYFDYNGYGQGEKRDGCLMLINMGSDDRCVYISTSGFCIYAMTDYGIDKTLDDVVPYLQDRDFVTAMTTYIYDVDSMISYADNNDEPYDVDTSSSESTGFQLKYLGVGILAGLVIAIIVVSLLYKQLKTVSKKASASDYYVDGSLQLTGSSDYYVGTYIHKTAKQKSSSGGSSTHTSSSGSSHGGGGRSF